MERTPAPEHVAAIIHARAWKQALEEAQVVLQVSETSGHLSVKTVNQQGCCEEAQQAEVQVDAGEGYGEDRSSSNSSKDEEEEEEEF